MSASKIARSTLLATLCLVFGCKRDGGEHIRFGLNWLPEAEHCGFFYAQATGLYRKAGLDVELVPSGPGTNVAMMVAGGQEDLAMGSSFTTLNMVKQGIPGVTVAAFFQRDPQTLVAHADQGIRTLEDVRNRPVMVSNASRAEFWQFLKARFGFSDQQLRPYTFNSATFLSDPTSVQQGYVTSDGYYLGNKLPKPPVTMVLADYGYSNYASTVFGLKSFIDQHPQAVRAFVKATAEGYRACITGDYTLAMKAATAMNPDPSYGPPLWHHAIKQMQDRHIVVEAGKPTSTIGSMSDERWRSFFIDMTKAGVYDKSLDYRRAYSLEYSQ